MVTVAAALCCRVLHAWWVHKKSLHLRIGAVQHRAMQNQVPDEFMQAAIAQARKSRNEGGIPIGSALMRDGKLLAVGHNKRVQENDPVTHAEIDCLRHAGRIGNFKETVLYSTLMPCYLCAGAVVQFGIKKVIVGENQTFAGAPEFMQEHGIEVVNLDLPECVEMMRSFIAEHPQLWNEDIGR
jgi:cytosine/creatinine deaminase